MSSPELPNGNGRRPNDREVIEVRAEDLPLHCPMPGSSLWDSHPRVYVPLEGEGEASCPYCGTRYVLKAR